MDYCLTCGHPQSEHVSQTKLDWLECACCDEGDFVPGGHPPAPKISKERKKRIMANRAALRKQVWQAIDSYGRDMLKEFKRNGTVEGKALGTKEEAPIALKVLTNQLATVSKKANAVVKESKPKKAVKTSKKAAKKGKGRAKKAGSFSDIPVAAVD